MNEFELIRLGIAIDYPINWNMRSVLRDLMQNFYDAVGRNGFEKEVRYETGNVYKGSLYCLMETEGYPFSYEWLNYIGGSTKTEHPGKYIGMYGEGFKMCVLQLLRFSVNDIRMESQDWAITPCEYEETISGKAVKMLGYRLFHRVDDGFTRLTVRGIHRDYKYYLEEIKYYFFYPENPLFGKKIVEQSDFSLYDRSSMPCPSEYFDPDFAGIMYINGLARARLDIPVIINIIRKDYDKEQRNRNNMYSFRAKRLISVFSKTMDSRSSYYLLIRMRNKWNDIPEGIIDSVDTWYYAVCNLVRNISSSRYYKRLFKKNYPDLYYIDRHCNNKGDNQFIGEAEAWAKSLKLPHNLKVNPVFRLLYASSVVDKYLESMQKFYRSCSDYEERRICILFRAIEILYGIGMFYDERPKIFIFDRDVREVGGYFPQVFWVRDYSCKSVRKYRIEKLILCKDDVVTNDFGGALIKLLDLLANAYSMERSSKRAYMLTNVGKMLIKQRHAITLYIKEWSDVRE